MKNLNMIFDTLATKHDQEFDVIAERGLSCQTPIPRRHALWKLAAVSVAGGVPLFGNPRDVTAAQWAASYKGFSRGQCTYYAALRFDQVAPSPKHDWRGNAGQWLVNAAAKNWTTGIDQELTMPGAIIVWRGGPGGAGHVGVVDAVHASGVTISEMNWPRGAWIVPRFLRWDQLLHRGGHAFAGYVFPLRQRVHYQAHVQNIGWMSIAHDGGVAGTSGRSLRVEAFRLTTPGRNISYQAHVQNIGWQPRFSNGAIAGTTGRRLQVEAFRIWVSRGNVRYWAHVGGIGWMGPFHNGQAAGTVGQRRRVEAFRVVVSG